jgi:hypothetical protein
MKKVGKITIYYPGDPEYLEGFYRNGPGVSITGRQAARMIEARQRSSRPEPQQPGQEQDPAQQGDDRLEAPQTPT